MKKVYEKSYLGTFRVILHPKASAGEKNVTPRVGNPESLEGAETLAKAWARQNPGANIEVVQVTGVYRGAVEVFQVEDIGNAPG